MDAIEHKARVERIELLDNFATMIRHGGMSVPDFVRWCKNFPELSSGLALVAYNGSINDALKLHEKVLDDGWEWTVSAINSCLYSGHFEEIISENNNLPSRAWLINILMVLKFIEEGK